MRSSWFLVVVLFAGCGGSNARCDLRPKESQCTDWRKSLSPTWAVEEALCKTLGTAGESAKFTAGSTCDTNDMWGGCQVTSVEGRQQTNWYYKGTSYDTLAKAKAECSSDMQWVDPS